MAENISRTNGVDPEGNAICDHCGTSRIFDAIESGFLNLHHHSIMQY
ncbi:MAG: hypothetical protein ABJH85_15095 [Paracoccaceae bacterium]